MTFSWASAEGAFTRADLYSAGMGDSRLRELRHNGTLLSFRRGTYVRAAEYYAADAPGRHALQVASLQLALSRTNIAAAGLSAAQIHGLALRHAPGPRLYVTTDDPGVVGTARDGYVLRAAPLPPEDICVVRGVRTTSPLRTVLDLICESEFVPGVVVTESALRQTMVTKPELHARLDRAAGRPGIEMARRIVEFADPMTESALESASNAHLHLENIPKPEIQVWLFHDIRVDKFWRIGRGVAGEDDGEDKYIAGGPARTRQVVADDLERARRIRSRYVLVRWGWAELDRPADLAATLRQAFAIALNQSA